MRAWLRCLAVAALLAACAGDGFEEPEDDAWADGKADGTGTTVGPLRVVEVRLGRSGEAAGAFVELLNVGDAPVDLDGWLVSFGRRRVALVPFGERGHVIPPGGLALVVDDDVDLASARLPEWLPVMTTSRDLGDLLTGSRLLVVRTPARAISDRADASRRTPAPGVSLERRSDDTWVESARGATPGERNAAQGPAIEAIFANPYHQAANPLPERLVRLIDDARSTIDAAIYQLGDSQVVDALVRAAERGVRVRFVTDTRYFTDPAYAPEYQRLVAAGIPVVDDRRTARMHNKFVIVDGELVWTGSFNPIRDERHQRFVHADNVILVRSRAFAEAHTIEFEEMFGGKFGPQKRDNTPHELHVDGVKIEVYFAPTDRPKAAILRELLRARENVYFCTFAFYQPDVGDAMLAALGQGVDVRGVFDDRGSAGESAQYPRLAAAGADVRRPVVDLFLHHKYILVDYGSIDPVVITGSYNFSDKADVANDEALYVIHDRELAQAYYAIYRSIYDAAAGENSDTTGLATVAITEVLADGGAGAFVELTNYGDAVVDLGDLTLSDRDAAPVAVAPLAGGRRAIAPGERVVVRPAGALLVEPDDPLVVRDGRRRIVTTFDAPRWAGAGRSLHRDELTAPDWAATWSAAAPTPGQ